jgi:hypothetical protein
MQLRRRPHPRRLDEVRLPFERHTYRVTATVTGVGRSHAPELPLVLRQGRVQMLAAVPAAACVRRAVPYRRRQMQRARRTAQRCEKATVIGVAFFARGRSRSGAHSNGLKLDPILGFRCQTSLRPAPPPPPPPPPPKPPPPPPPTDPVVAAAGDIACDPASDNFNGGAGTATACKQGATAQLIESLGVTGVLALGDTQYYCGGYSAFLQSYDRSWGAFKARTHPTVGNHEYLTSGGTDCNAGNAGANGYFTYFGASAGARGQGYYSFDLGTWHLIALNSNCSDAGGCTAGSPQGLWLAADLATHQNMCTLAFWHIPLFSSGGLAQSGTRPLWQLLYDHNADLILSGHDHIYERFAPQTASGALDQQRGIREFIVGTGGANHSSITGNAANSEVRDALTFGVLKLTLHPTSYEWSFVPTAGGTFTDSGTTPCH